MRIKTNAPSIWNEINEEKEKPKLIQIHKYILLWRPASSISISIDIALIIFYFCYTYIWSNVPCVLMAEHIR